VSFANGMIVYRTIRPLFHFYPFERRVADIKDSYEHHNIDEPAILLGGGFVVGEGKQP
jgi:hypothetical protein